MSTVYNAALSTRYTDDYVARRSACILRERNKIYRSTTKRYHLRDITTRPKNDKSIVWKNIFPNHVSASHVRARGWLFKYLVVVN